MITKLSKEELVALGLRHRAGYLLEQYGYTMGLAQLDRDGIVKLLPRGFLEDFAACAESVGMALKDKVLKAEEAKGSTQNVNGILRRAKEWRRTVVNRALCGKRLGNKVPAGLLKVDKLESVPEVAARINAMVQLLEASQDEIPGEDVEALIDEGKRILSGIQSIDADQEVKRGSTMPASVRNFQQEKGRLYCGIKAVNDAGRALHAGDPVSAAKYNLSILHRHAGKRKGEPAAAV